MRPDAGLFVDRLTPSALVHSPIQDRLARLHELSRRGMGTGGPLSDFEGLSIGQIWQWRSVTYSNQAAFSWACWEFLITFADEVQYIWLTPWRWTNLLFFFVRYFPPLAIGIIIFYPACHELVVFEVLAIFTLVVAVDVMLMLRVYAMYSRSRIVLRCLVAGFVAEIVAMAVSVAFMIPSLISSTCSQVDAPLVILLFGVAAVAFQTALFILTLRKFLNSLKEPHNRSATGIIRLLARDGTWAFGVMFITVLANVLLFSLAPKTLNSIAYSWLLASLGIVGSRLALNIRAKVANPTSGARAGPDLALDDLSSLHLSQIRTVPGPSRYSTHSSRMSEQKPFRTDVLTKRSPPFSSPPLQPDSTKNARNSLSLVTPASAEKESGRLLSAVTGGRLSICLMDPHQCWAVRIAETPDECY